jgi:aldose 1-epimerase
VIELRSGSASATIDPARGGRLASLRIGDRELLVGPPDDTDSTIRWGCYLMAPWPGRLADGRLRFRGRTWQLRRTHGRHAIHGLVWAVPWEVTEASVDETTLTVGLDRDGWPFGGEVRQAWRLEPGRVVIEATITAEQAMPAALGWHPWFRRETPDPSLLLDAAGTLAAHRMIPTGEVDPLTRKTDLRGGPVLGRRRLDHTYVGARSPAVLRWPDLELRVEFGAEADTVVVYTPWNAVCIEPQTALPNALGRANSAAAGVAGAVPRILEAGERLASRIVIAWE